MLEMRWNISTFSSSQRTTAPYALMQQSLSAGNNKRSQIHRFACFKLGNFVEGQDRVPRGKTS